jgi:hypothetical protein
MEKIVVEKTFSSPSVLLDPENGLFEIEGRLIPEDPDDFFKPIIFWIENYFKSGKTKLKVNLRLYYYNTSSSKRILLIMKRLNEWFLQGKDISLTWEYEDGDEDCMEDGEDYKSHLKLPFEIRMFEEN